MQRNFQSVSISIEFVLEDDEEDVVDIGVEEGVFASEQEVDEAN